MDGESGGEVSATSTTTDVDDLASFFCNFVGQNN